MESKFNTPDQYQDRARQDFDSALRKSGLRKVLNSLTKRSDELLPYDQVLSLLPVDGQHYAGMQQVPIKAIIGSVGRFQDFDRAFLPKRSDTRNRWESVDRAHLMEVDLPAVELYKVGDVYFVKDGNHRVSVAREKGQVFIDAAVIEINTPVPITPSTNLVELIGKREMNRFYQKTNLKQTRPDANIDLSIPEMYSNLLEHIQTHGWFLCEERNICLSFSEIAESWFDNVYLPMVKIIEEKEILNGFPHRTEADLYVWIMEHRWYLMKEAAKDISLEDAADHFSSSYASSPWKKFLKFISKVFKKPGEI